VNHVPTRRSDGTIQFRREMQPWPKDRPFRILSIDGGGICGLLPAAVLAEIEQRFLGGAPVSDYFDLVAGTSTGGLIALGLGAGMSGAQLKQFYIERGPNIFPSSDGVTGKARGMLKWAKQKVRTLYDVAPLEAELMRVFEQRFFGDSKLRLCVPSFEGTHGEPWIYKTPHHPDYKKDRHERMFTVGRATSAAPTYFKPLDTFGYRMVDGGLWANNPVMIGLVDALACFDIDREQVQILTLGCGENSFHASDSQVDGGELQWRNAIRGAMRAQSRNALGQAFLLVGKDRVVRLDAPESPNPIAMDDVGRALAELPNMARSLVEGAGHRVNEMFLGDKVVPYQPIMM
jgi:patatin-like phospholipase/acyl hydrolase